MERCDQSTLSVCLSERPALWLTLTVIKCFLRGLPPLLSSRPQSEQSEMEAMVPEGG